MNNTPKSVFFIIFDLEFFFSHRYPLIKQLSKQNIQFYVIAHFEGDPPANEENISYIYINSSRKKFGFFNLIQNSISLSRHINTTDPDIIYAVSHRSIFLARVANLFSRKKSLYAISGMGSMFTKQLSFMKDMRTALLKFVALKIYQTIVTGKGVHFLLQNTDDLDLLVDYKIASSSNSFIVPGNGLEKSFFSPPRKINNNFKFIMIARVLKDKGVIEFLLAAQKVVRLFPQSEFTLYGAFDSTNPNEIKHEELTKYLGPRIKYAGHIKDIRSKIINSSVVVLPSYREGFSKVLMEAQACSKPVITSDISGCRDVIIENKTGYLVRPQDADDLANKILFMLANIESYDVLAKNAYDHAREKFSLDSAVSQHIEIFNNITI